MKIGKSLFNQRMNESVQQQKASKMRPRKYRSPVPKSSFILNVPRKRNIDNELAMLETLLNIR